MKQLFSLGIAVLASSLVFTNCTKEAQDIAPEVAGEFTIVASSSTKTTNDGLGTKWAANDDINLFHAEAGTTAYKNDKEFSISAADLTDGKFKGTLAAALESDKSYDWYATYPYSSYITTPANTAKGYSYIGCRSDAVQTQVESNNLSHIAGTNYPLYGKATGVSASDVPAITMKPAFSVVEIKVKNTTAEKLSVSDIAFTAPESLVGTFYIDFSGDEASFKDGQYVSNTATLNVTNSTIAAGSSATFYLAVKPFTATSGKELSISVNGYSKKLTLSKDATFEEGKIKQLVFNYDKAATTGEPTIQYTLTPTKGKNNDYALDCDITINEVTWNLTGNSTMLPWRIGGKNLTKVDRALYSKTAIPGNISQLVIKHSGANSVTVNSMTVYVCSTAAGAAATEPSDVVAKFTPKFVANGDVTIDKVDDTSWANCYYRIVYNVTITDNKNKYIAFNSAKFYGFAE